MTKSGLEKWRFLAPYLIVSNAVIPIVIAFVADMDRQTKIIQVVVLPVSLVFAFIYSMMSLRDPEWYRELNRHVVAQIRTELLGLIPVSLAVTKAEKDKLSEREIWKKLTGVFWEAIDSDPELVRHKEHFYANGVFYTTAIDICILLPAVSLIYSFLWLYRQEPLFLICSAACLGLGLLSWVLFLPSRRKRHLELSREQLDLLKRKKKDFIQDRFRDIVTEWRVEKAAQQLREQDVANRALH